MIDITSNRVIHILPLEKVHLEQISSLWCSMLYYLLAYYFHCLSQQVMTSQVAFEVATLERSLF